MKEYRFWALRRSGHHAVIDWVKDQYNNAFFVNDILSYKVFIYFISQYTNDIHINDSRLTSIDIDKMHQTDHYMYNIEDCTFDRGLRMLKSLKQLNVSYIGDDIIDIMVLRDPFNLFASRKRGLWPKATPDINNIAYLYKEYAKEFLRRTHNFDTLIPINYNIWFQSKEYRHTLLKELNTDSAIENKSSLNSVSPYGILSSFDEMLYDGKAQEMKVLHRWEYYKNDDDYINLFNDEELLELTRNIFGETEAYRYITGRISKSSVTNKYRIQENEDLIQA